MRSASAIAVLSAAPLWASACVQDFGLFHVVDTTTGAGTGGDGGSATTSTGGAGGNNGTAGHGGSAGSPSGGSGNGGSVGPCHEKPEPPGAGCPAPCTSCNAGECVVDCSLTDCESAVTCPQGFSCTVLCNKNRACRESFILCPETYACKIVCSDVEACEETQITCDTGVCDLECGTQDEVCKGMWMLCDEKACSATCAGTSKPQVDCSGQCPCIKC